MTQFETFVLIVAELAISGMAKDAIVDSASGLSNVTSAYLVTPEYFISMRYRILVKVFPLAIRVAAASLTPRPYPEE